MCGPHEVDVSLRLRRRWRRLQVDKFRYPVLIDRRTTAIARKQRSGNARDAGQQKLIERLLQHVQTGDANDGIDVAADDDLEDYRRPLGDEYLVAEVFGHGLEVGD